MTRWRIDPRHVDDVHLALGLTFPAAAGLALFGWRCLGVWAFILAGALLGRLILSRLRTWTATPGRWSLAVQSAVVGLFVPATLFDVDRATVQADAHWPLLLAFGFALALAEWACRQARRPRTHAAVLVACAATLLPPALTRTDRVLTPQSLGGGDVLDARTTDRPAGTAEPWMDAPPGVARVVRTPPAEAALQSYLNGKPPPGRPNQTVTRLLGDDLPPLEDLVVGGHPTPIGRGSVIALVIGGLFLVYRGLTPLRVPAMALLACYTALALLPLPTGVGGGGVRAWAFERDPRVGWAAGLTLVHYLLAAGTVPIVATFLLPLPGVRPVNRRVAAGFAVVFGVAAAAGTVYVGIVAGPLLALALTQLLWPRKRRTAVPSPGVPGGGNKCRGIIPA